jgi:hypothetical protein
MYVPNKLENSVIVPFFLNQFSSRDTYIWKTKHAPTKNHLVLSGP